MNIKQLPPPHFGYGKTKHGGCAPLPSLTPGEKAEAMHIAHVGSPRMCRHRCALHADK